MPGAYPVDGETVHRRGAVRDIVAERSESESTPSAAVTPLRRATCAIFDALITACDGGGC